MVNLSNFVLVYYALQNKVYRDYRQLQCTFYIMEYI